MHVQALQFVPPELRTAAACELGGETGSAAALLVRLDLRLVGLPPTPKVLGSAKSALLRIDGHGSCAVLVDNDRTWFHMAPVVISLREHGQILQVVIGLIVVEMVNVVTDRDLDACLVDDQSVFENVSVFGSDRMTRLPDTDVTGCVLDPPFEGWVIDPLCEGRPAGARAELVGRITPVLERRSALLAVMNHLISDYT